MASLKTVAAMREHGMEKSAPHPALLALSVQPLTSLERGGSVGRKVAAT